MEYRILGPLEVLDARGHSLSLGGARQQSVLASLLLRAGHTVALERLIDELWEERPETAAKTVQVYVSRLRHELPAGAIESRAGGYALLLDGDRLDLRSFEQAAKEGRAALAAGDCERAAELLRQALALWRGPALAGLSSDALRREAERLEEVRLRVLEDRLEADLGCAREGEVVPELQALVSEHPLRERPRAQLMLALYRADRQAEALAFYRETRSLLVEELGLEPSEELQRLERQILAHDPEIEFSRQAVVPDETAANFDSVGQQPSATSVTPSVASNRLPTGTVTFVFTDIEGSTALAKRLPDGYAEVLEQHQLLLRAAFEGHGGHEVDTQGDSFFFAFARAKDAVVAIVEAQRALTRSRVAGRRRGARADGPAHRGARHRRAALQSGFGVHRAARISAAGHGGQVLLSNATRELVEDDLPEDVAIRDLGTYQLKDIDRPERLFQLAVDGLPTRVSPAPGARSRRAAPPASPRDPALCSGQRDRRGRRDPHLRVRPGRIGRVDRGCGRQLGRLRRPRLEPARRGRSGRHDADPPSARRRHGLGDQCRRPHGLADRPCYEGRRPDDRCRQQPERDRDRERRRLGGQQPGRHRLADRPRDQHGCPNDPRRQPPVGIAYAAGSIWVANTGDDTITRIDADSGRPANAASDRGDRARLRRRNAVGEREDGEPCGPHRPEARDASCSRSRSGTARPGSPSAAAPPGWRTAWTGPSRESIPRRIRSRRPSSRQRPDGDRRRRARRLGKQPVRGHAGANRSTDEPGVRRITVGNRPQGVAISGGDVLVSRPPVRRRPSRRHADGADEPLPRPRSTPPSPTTRPPGRSCA